MSKSPRLALLRLTNGRNRRHDHYHRLVRHMLRNCLYTCARADLRISKDDLVDPHTPHFPNLVLPDPQRSYRMEAFLASEVNWTPLALSAVVASPSKRHRQPLDTPTQFLNPFLSRTKDSAPSPSARPLVRVRDNNNGGGMTLYEPASSHCVVTRLGVSMWSSSITRWTCRSNVKGRSLIVADANLTLVRREETVGVP